MTSELQVLLSLAAVLGFTHTISGPDHYLPFIVLSKARKWSIFKTTWLTLLCGLGHVGSSIVLGAVGLALGIGIKNVENVDNSRGSIAAWVLVAFGIGYMLWGFYRAKKNKPHKHFHTHPGNEVHEHIHSYEDGEHTHQPVEEKKFKLTPWVLFIFFVLGPCEPLIATLIYPAANLSSYSTLLVIAVFTLATLATMLTAVLLISYGLKITKFGKMEKYMHVFAGGTILLSGLAIIYLGL